MPWGPFYSALPGTGTPTKKYVDQASWNAVIDNFQNWKGNVNGGGFSLTNVVIPGVTAGVSGSASLTFPAMEDGENAVRTFTVTGAAVGDPVAPAWPATLEAGLFGMMRVSAANTIEVRLHNNSGAPLTPAVQTF